MRSVRRGAARCCLPFTLGMALRRNFRLLGELERLERGREVSLGARSRSEVALQGRRGAAGGRRRGVGRPALSDEIGGGEGGEGGTLGRTYAAGSTTPSRSACGTATATAMGGACRRDDRRVGGSRNASVSAFCFLFGHSRLASSQGERKRESAPQRESAVEIFEKRDSE